MLRVVVAILLLLHGLIHLMGFTKAFGFAEIKTIAAQISKPMGLAWLFAALLCTASSLLLFSGKTSWWMIALPAMMLSQALIIPHWQDAKFGTIANLLILLAIVLSWGSWQFERSFLKDVRHELRRHQSEQAQPVTESDLSPLPAPVQRYLRKSGVVGRPRVLNMRVEFEGEMREKGKDFFLFHSVQHNSFDAYTRLFYMTARMKGIDVPGYHRYTDRHASMDIRLFGLIPVVRHSGPVMDKTETVTLFNDMCLMAPATLIDPRIRWEARDSLSAKAMFTNGTITISAILYFNTDGMLVDFVSDDRTEVNHNMQIPFSTPIRSWQEINGRTFISEGDAVWHYPDGAFVYGRFRLKRIEYNVQE
jgi:uncharacterized membrane protein YphA (DoxX/SURF4 family)